MFTILIEFCIRMNLVRLNRLCLSETYSSVRVDKNLSDTFPIRNGMKQEDNLSPFLINFSAEYDIRRFQANQEGMKLNGILQLLVYVDDVNILIVIVHAIQGNAKYLVMVGREIGLEVNADKTK